MRWQKNNDYLVVRIYRDLVGDWVVTQCWGSSGEPGAYSHTLVDSYSDALELLREIGREQRQRGFRRKQSREEQLGFDFS
ncbi:hypothetical protein [Marinobacterium weihaiense]|uniref:hypothetical protein n=1 Tax=Marinobacterium weihaiense TaxID=2851016 RepID=UPI002E1D39D4